MLVPTSTPSISSLRGIENRPPSVLPALQKTFQTAILSTVLSACQPEVAEIYCTQDDTDDSIGACLARDREIIYLKRSKLITPDNMEQGPIASATSCKILGPDSESEYCSEEDADVCEVAKNEARALVESQNGDWVGTAVTSEGTSLETGETLSCCVTAVNYGQAAIDSHTVVDCEIKPGAPVGLACKGGFTEDEIVEALCEDEGL